jgi:signal transduction histidine kinase
VDVIRSIRSDSLKVILIVLLIVLGIGSYAYNQYLVSSMLEKERSSVELWAKAIEYNGKPLHAETRDLLIEAIQEIRRSGNISASQKSNWVEAMRRAESELSNAQLDFVANELIIKNRFQIPSIVTDGNGNILHSRNLNGAKPTQKLIQQFNEANAPIEIVVGDEDFYQRQMVFYGESPTVRWLRYYPYFQFTLLALLIGLGYMSYSSIRRTEQSNLWVGMAKEAAHQLGTPVSSLYGWIELLKSKHADEETLQIVHELQNDVKRLQSVADRFNKIGSEPELTLKRIGPILKHVVDYMERRMPQLGKAVKFKKDIDINVQIRLNQELFQWAIENLIKNALDAIKDVTHQAWISIHAHQLEDQLIIDIEDSGMGINKKDLKEIFKPGFSTKKRGWGLGLSLTRRIIEEYHQGELFVLETEPNHGTTMRIVMPLPKESMNPGA